jgi:hypothetical protein
MSGRINQMQNNPIVVSEPEFNELAQFKDLQEVWGANNAAEMAEYLSNSYCAKFYFMNGTPGYIGDLFIIQGDHLTEALPIRVVRQNGKLEVVSDDE